jgi:rhamnulokinase
MHVAIDLGAGSGRALIGRVSDAGLAFEEVHRFAYGPRTAGGHLRWDLARLEAGLLDGLAAAQDAASMLGELLQSVGVDAWGVD